MKHAISRRDAIIGMGSAAALTAVPLNVFAASHATVHEVLMLNKDPDDPKKKMLFSPHMLEVNAGDTVKFVPADKVHNSESIKGMLPKGVDKWKSKINKEIEVTFDTPGFYGYQCKPHANMGMIGLIVVNGEGKLDNLEDAKGAKQRGKAKKAWKKLWKEADAVGLTA
jgi:pseudoazurin